MSPRSKGRHTLSYGCDFAIRLTSALKLALADLPRQWGPLAVLARLYPYLRIHLPHGHNSGPTNYMLEYCTPVFNTYTQSYTYVTFLGNLPATRIRFQARQGRNEETRIWAAAVRGTKISDMVKYLGVTDWNQVSVETELKVV